MLEKIRNTYEIIGIGGCYQRCKKYEVEWQKTYLDGTRDFHEVIYIFHDGDEKYIAEEDEDLD